MELAPKSQNLAHFVSYTDMPGTQRPCKLARWHYTSNRDTWRRSTPPPPAMAACYLQERACMGLPGACNWLNTMRRRLEGSERALGECERDRHIASEPQGLLRMAQGNTGEQQRSRSPAIGAHTFGGNPSNPQLVGKLFFFLNFPPQIILLLQNTIG